MIRKRVKKSQIKSLLIWGLADENGLVIEKGRGSYSEHNFTLKLEINIKGQDSKEMTALKEHLEYLNETLTKKIDINKSYTDGDQTFKLTGYKTRQENILTSLLTKTVIPTHK